MKSLSPTMSRTVERVIDLLATSVLLSFAWLLREGQPGLAGAVVMASISFWLNKNAVSPDSTSHMDAAAQVTAAATAAAEVLRTAVIAAQVKDDKDIKDMEDKFEESAQDRHGS